MSQEDFCIWCDALVSLPDSYNNHKDVALCLDPRCMVIQCLFAEHFSNKAILDREYLDEILTKGGIK